MEALWAGLGAFFVGAVGLIAALTVRRNEREQDWLRMLLDDCAVIYASERSFLTSVATYMRQGMKDRVSSYDPSDRLLASARLRLLTTDSQLIDADRALSRAGRALSVAIAVQECTYEEAGALRADHELSMAQFVEQAQQALRHRKVIA